jgi:hypothetical protein
MKRVANRAFDPEDWGDMFLWNTDDFEQITQHYIIEYNHSCENLKSHNLTLICMPKNLVKKKSGALIHDQTHSKNSKLQTSFLWTSKAYSTSKHIFLLSPTELVWPLVIK